MPDLEVVFVAACQSEFIGGIFKKCGASHVVCVKQSEHVLDEAAIDFTKSFYQHLFDEFDVCEAFKVAKKDVEFKYKSKESDLFTLLKNDDHLCIGFPMRPEGEFECLTDHTQINIIRNKLQDI